MAQYSRRFKIGDSRFMTRAWIEGDDVIIHQAERVENTKICYNSSFLLSVADFKKMVATLGLTDIKP